jgi:hypothetical protein
MRSPEEPLVLRWYRKDGGLIWTEQRNMPIYDEAGNVIAMEGIARDITKRKLAEEARRYHSSCSSPESILVSLARGSLSCSAVMPTLG